MRLLVWLGAMVLVIGAVGGILGALADRAARPGTRPLSEVASAYVVGRFASLRSASRRRASSGG